VEAGQDEAGIVFILSSQHHELNQSHMFENRVERNYDTETTETVIADKVYYVCVMRWHWKLEYIIFGLTQRCCQKCTLGLTACILTLGGWLVYIIPFYLYCEPESDCLDMPVWK
jgi:hypothetical protein